MNYIDYILTTSPKAPPIERCKRVVQFLIDTEHEQLLAVAIINFLQIQPKNSIHANAQMIINLPDGRREEFLEELQSLIGSLKYLPIERETKH